MDSSEIDIKALQAWIGQTETVEDIVTAVPIRALAATLDHAWTQTEYSSTVLPCWHWLYFMPICLQAEVGHDGHPKRGGFLPPIPLPRRMWAGSRIEFFRPLRMEQTIRRQSRIEDIQMKTGKSGPLVFVKLAHSIEADGDVVILERQDIVYRQEPQPGVKVPAGLPAPHDAQWARHIVPDAVLLFRYSALTFNGHRIHYDRSYATEVEGYPGLVVHGPLLATLLLDLLRRERPKANVINFEFKAIRPVFDIEPFEICGRMDGERRARLWAVAPDGSLAMEASVMLA